MKIAFKILAFIIAAYLLASLAASAIVTLTNNNVVYREIVTRRYGLLVADLTDEHLVIYSPFNNYGDIFLAVIDWSDNPYFYTDGLEFFGEWNQ